MRYANSILAMACMAAGSLLGAEAESIYGIVVKAADGSDVSMKDYEGKVLLIVNVASECGFTKQYAGLQALYEAFQEQGLVVIGFPCNQFGGQEPGSNEEIHAFCTSHFSVTFPVMDKIEVNGKNAHPLYQLLKHRASGLLGSEAIKWNFTKFLVDRQGHVVKRYGSSTKPEALRDDIVKCLGAVAGH